MTNQVNPTDPRLQAWLKEGLVARGPHAHPSLSLPAKGRFRRGGPHLSRLRRPDEPDSRQPPGRVPDAVLRLAQHRQPSVLRRDLQQDQSRRPLPLDRLVGLHRAHRPTTRSLPRDLVFDPDGKERFRKYIPFPSFVNTIENYPYPYVIGGVCWEFPCIVPSDWEGQNIQKPNNPKTLEDMKAALDCVVLKQGVFNLVFHPHGWIKSEQVVELIDHAVKKHGKKVKFLNFREAQERLNKNLLGDNPLRTPMEPTAESDWSTETVMDTSTSHCDETRQPARISSASALPVPRSSMNRAATPAFASSTSTKTAISTSFSRTIRNMAFIFSTRRPNGLDAQGHGGQGR